MPPRDRIDVDNLRGRRLERPDLGEAIKIDEVENSVHKSMQSAVAARLNLGGELPPDVAKAIKSAAVTAAASAVQLTVADAAIQATRDVGRAGLNQRFDDKIGVAAASLGHISQSSQVDEVLRNRAQLLAKKRDALVTAGFANEEAMQIVLADIAARAH